MTQTYEAMNGLFLEDLKVGQSAMFGSTVTEADIVAFAGVSGDTNPIHLHDGFARTTRFGQRIAHGMLSGSFISTVIGTKLPGPGAVYISQTMNFMAPVIIGDTITAVATITAIDAAAPPGDAEDAVPQRRQGRDRRRGHRAGAAARRGMIPVFDHWQKMPAPWKGGAVALGNFDGVHSGHQALLARTAEHARALDAPLVALTFEPHPRRFFVPDTGPFRLTLPPAKLRLLEQYGVQAVLAQRFDTAFAAVSADAFIDEVLLQRTGRAPCRVRLRFHLRRAARRQCRDAARDGRRAAALASPCSIR